MLSDPRPPRSPFDPAPPQQRRIGPAHLAVIAVASVAALGLMGLKFVNLPDAAAVAPGDGLKIEIVAPVEPEPVPGSVMEVGELVDGFRYVAPEHLPSTPVRDVAWNEDEDFAPSAPALRPAGPRRYATVDAETPSAESGPPRRERGRRWFGFDNPLPDFGAERRARQARLDAIEDRRRAEREDRLWSSESSRYDEHRDDRRGYNLPRDERPAEDARDGPYGPEEG